MVDPSGKAGVHGGWGLTDLACLISGIPILPKDAPIPDLGRLLYYDEESPEVRDLVETLASKYDISSIETYLLMPGPIYEAWMEIEHAMDRFRRGKPGGLPYVTVEIDLRRYDETGKLIPFVDHDTGEERYPEGPTPRYLFEPDSVVLWLVKDRRRRGKSKSARQLDGDFLRCAIQCMLRRPRECCTKPKSTKTNPYPKPKPVAMRIVKTMVKYELWPENLPIPADLEPRAKLLSRFLQYGPVLMP